MPTVIKPTIGRVVHYYPRETTYAFGHAVHKGEPHAALITVVHSDRLVNVVVFDRHGKSFPVTSIRLNQDGDGDMEYPFVSWMPYQVGQAAKTEAVQAELAAKTEASEVKKETV